MIYFDAAATGKQKPPEVAQAVVQAMESFGGVGRGVHEASLNAGMAVYETREKVAQLFGVPSARNVAFSANATESLNVVAGLLQPGDHVITTAASHNSILRPLYRKHDEEGVELSIVPLARDGSLDYEAFERLIQSNTRLALVTHASNLTGDIYDIAHLAKICHAHGVLFGVDAAQTAGHIALDMVSNEIDILVFTGHKSLFGPQGTGGLCLNGSIEIPPLLVGGSGSHSYDHSHPSTMPERLEAGTLNSHGIAGLGAGIDFIETCGRPTIAAKVSGLRLRFISEIASFPSIKVYGNQEYENCGIVALNIADEDSALVSDMLSTEFGICTRSGAHCAPLMHESLGTKEQGAVRFSFSYFNTESEISQGVEALVQIAARLGEE